ncbi:MAG: beta-ketoacyl synthase chain length factor [Burkholderiales bacterium]
MKAFVLGAGATGIADWSEAGEILSGARSLADRVSPQPKILPPAEQRRAAESVRYALAAADAAMTMSGLDRREVASVFTSSGGDGNTLHQICEALAGTERTVSPTRFHNSVHNAAAGYWSIACKSRAPSTTLCAYDASFAAGLLEAMSLVVVDRLSVLLVAFDCKYPEPLHALRPAPVSFAAAFVLTHERTPKTIAEWNLDIRTGAAPEHNGIMLNASARALPLLAALGREKKVPLEYLPGQHVVVECTG